MKLLSDPKLFDAGGDISKPWYVEYYWLNDDNIKKRERVKLGINRIHTKTGRYRKATEIIDAVMNIFESGVPEKYLNSSFQVETNFNIPSVLRDILEIKKDIITRRSYRDYTS